MEDAPSPPFFGVLWDDDLEKTELAVDAIVRGHLRVERWLRSQSRLRILTSEIVQDIHRTMFEGVFPTSAGRYRGCGIPGLDIDVKFGRKPSGGRYSGTPFSEVAQACERHFMQVADLIEKLDLLQHTATPDDFSREVLTVGCYVHCELVRIHPFAGGNGRTSRTLINYFAARYGFLPIPVDRPKGNYIEATQCWLERQRVDDLADLLGPSWQRR